MVGYKAIHPLLFCEYFHGLDFTLPACKKFFLSPPGSPGPAKAPGEFSAHVLIGQPGINVESALSQAAVQIFQVSLELLGSRCANWELPMQTPHSCIRCPSPVPGRQTCSEVGQGKGSEVGRASLTAGCVPFSLAGDLDPSSRCFCPLSGSTWWLLLYSFSPLERL